MAVLSAFGKAGTPYWKDFGKNKDFVVHLLFKYLIHAQL